MSHVSWTGAHAPWARRSGRRGEEHVIVRRVTSKPRNHVEDLRGASRLAIEATCAVTDLVEAMHHTIASGPDALGRPLERVSGPITGLIYGSIRGVTRLVGASIDRALAQLAPLAETAPAQEAEPVLAVVNGVLGDYLSETGNPLAIPTQLRQNGRALVLEPQALRAALPDASGRLLVLVHGSCMSDRGWLRLGHDHGAALARDLGYTPIYAFYNSGQHISANGRELAAVLEQLAAAWPVPLDEIAVVGHSMGGLVARSACHAAEVAGLAWRSKLHDLVCLGSPHHGAPLERGGSWLHFLLGVSRYSAPFARMAKIRSAGITDMRYGNVLDEHWHGRDRFALGRDPRDKLDLPEGVECYAIAATTAATPGRKLPGDGLVPVDSALGRHVQPELTLRFPDDHQSIAFGMGHLELLSNPQVYATMLRWLSRARS